MLFNCTLHQDLSGGHIICSGDFTSSPNMNTLFCILILILISIIRIPLYAALLAVFNITCIILTKVRTRLVEFPDKIKLLLSTNQRNSEDLTELYQLFP